jgi:hypothetical protein
MVKSWDKLLSSALCAQESYGSWSYQVKQVLLLQMARQIEEKERETERGVGL